MNALKLLVLFAYLSSLTTAFAGENDGFEEIFKKSTFKVFECSSTSDMKILAYSKLKMTGTKENPTFMHDMSKVVLIFDTSNEEIPMSPILSNVSFVKQTDGSYLANQVKSPIDAKAGSIKIDVLGRHLYIMDAPGAKPRNILPCSLVSKILKQQK